MKGLWLLFLEVSVSPSSFMRSLESEENTSHSSSNFVIEADCQHYSCAIQRVSFHLSLNQNLSRAMV